VKEIIRKRLKEYSDNNYKEFLAKLIPNLDKSLILGVRTPILKKLAKELYNEADINSFLEDLPHKYLEENLLHVFIISLYKDFNKTIDFVSKFLPYVNNWAVCDQLNPLCFNKNKTILLEYLNKFLKTNQNYHIRFSIRMYMKYFLDENFKMEYALKISNIKSDDYYVKMMISWYFATALFKQYDKIIPLLESKKFDKWINNKIIQKSLESYRISDLHKEYLKTLKI
jgi:3-methyladenine DNA glycosylase AlkD